MASLFERGLPTDPQPLLRAGMTGVRASDAQSAAAFAGFPRTVPVRASLKAERGRKARMCMESPFASASVLSEEDVRPAEKSPLTEEERAFSFKLGGTGFSLESFELETDGASYLGASELNLLRRSAVAALTDPPCADGKRRTRRQRRNFDTVLRRAQDTGRGDHGDLRSGRRARKKNGRTGGIYGLRTLFPKKRSNSSTRYIFLIRRCATAVR